MLISSILGLVIIIFIYTSILIIKNENFYASLQRSDVFLKKLQGFSGYVVILQRKNINSKVTLLRKIVSIIKERGQCIVLDIEPSRKLDWEIVEKFNAYKIPSITYIENGEIVKEVFNFEFLYLNKELQTKDILNEIKILLD